MIFRHDLFRRSRIEFSGAGLFASQKDPDFDLRFTISHSRRVPGGAPFRTRPKFRYATRRF